MESTVVRNDARKVTVPEGAPTTTIKVIDPHPFGEAIPEYVVRAGTQIWISRDRRLFSGAVPMSLDEMVAFCTWIGLQYEEVDYEKSCGHPWDDDMNLVISPTRLHMMMAGNVDRAEYWWQESDGFLLYVHHGQQLPDKPYYKCSEIKAALKLVTNHANEKLSLAFQTEGFNDEDLLRIWEESLAVKVMYSTTPLGLNVPFHGIEQKQPMGFAQIIRGGPAISDFALKLLGPGSALIVQWIDLDTDTVHKTVHVAKF